MERNYFRLICLLSDLAPRVLREFLKDQWQRAGCSSLIDLLNLEKHRFYHCLHPVSQYPHDKCCCRSNKESYKSMTEAQWNLLYEDIGSSATCSYTGKHPCKYRAKANVKPEDLDISLLRLVIDKIFPGNTALDNIRKLRNELIHSGTISVSDVEFGRLWISARSNILQIANTSATPFPAEIKREIDELETRSLDSSECERLLQFVKHLRENDNLLQDISSEVAVVKQKAESTETNVDAIKTKIESTESNIETMKFKVEAMDTEVRSIKTNVEFMNTNVEFAETKIEAMNTDIRSINTNVESMKTNVKATKTNVESMTTNVEATKANVEFTKTNVEEMKTKVESTETNAASTKTMVGVIDQKIDAISKTSRDSDIQRRIENTECVLKSHRKAFYVSLGAAEEKAYSRLQEKHLVTISGRAGSGKTSLGKQLMIKYCDQHTKADGTSIYTPVIISQPDDFDKINNENRLLVFIDDPFGASNVDDKVLKEWEKHFDNLLSYCTEGNIRIIIGVRSYLISEPEETFRKFDLFSKENIIDLSSQDKLTSTERVQLLKAYCKEYKVQIIDEEKETGRMSKESSSGQNKMKDTNISSLKCIQMCVLSEISKLDTFEGFPLACYRFFAIKSLFDQGAYFFKHPAESLKSEISHFEKREPILYLTLSLMLLEGGVIDPNNIDEDKLRTLKKQLGHTCRTVDIQDCCKCDISRVYIEREQLFFSGNKKTEYNLTHQTVMEAVLLSLWDRCPELVLQHSHYNIIAEFVRPSGYIPKKDELCVNVPSSEQHRLLAERVIRNGCSSILSYRGIYDASFSEVLLVAMEKTEALYEYRVKRQISLEQAVNGLIPGIGIVPLPFLKAVFNRFTHNGRKQTSRNIIKSTLKFLVPSKVKGKQPLVNLNTFLCVLNNLLGKKIKFAEESMMSCELYPMRDYIYRDRDGEDRTITPMSYALTNHMDHLIFFWVKMAGTLKDGDLLKEEILHQLPKMCCKSDRSDIFDILIQSNKHGKHGKVILPSSVYNKSTGFGKQMVQYFFQSNIDITLMDTCGNTLLHYCSRYGLITEVLKILKTHPGIVNERNKDGETAIIMAAKHGEKDTVNKMLQHRESNIDITVTDKDGNTLLHHCSRKGLTKEVLMILERHSKIVNLQNEDGETALMMAVEHREKEIVNEMLQHKRVNVDVTLTDKTGNTVLHLCSRYGLTTESLMILEIHPGIINYKNKDGETAIMLATMYWKTDIVEALLKHSNIDFTLTNNDGNNLLHFCSIYGLQAEVLIILETYPEIANVKNKDGVTAFMMAAIHREENTLNELLRHRKSNIDITLSDNDGNTLLHHCCRFGLKKQVLMILERHPEIVDVQNKDGETAVMMALHSWKTDIVKELVQFRESNIDITLPDNNGNTLLHHCCRFGLKKQVLMILERHPEMVNVQNKDGETAVMMALHSWKTDIVKELVQFRESNIDITLPDNNGNTLLHHCCRFGLKKQVLMILERHPEMVNVQNKDGETAVMIALHSWKTDIVKELVQFRESNIDITLPDNDGNTLLHHCCRFGLKKQVLMLLEAHPEIVNVQNENGETAIVVAAINKKEEILSEMLQHRESSIDIALTDKNGNTVLHYCCRYGFKKGVLMILETHPGIVNIQNKNCVTAIIMAAKHGREETVNKMLRHRESIIDATLTDKDGNTLLHHCCLSGLKTTVTIIQDIQPGIVNVQNRYGRTAICLAAMSRELDIVHELLQHRGSSIDIALTDKNGNTVLHYCCSYGFKKGVLMILETHPGIVNIQNENGVTAIIMAAKHGRENTVNEMLRHRESIIDVTLTDKDGNTLLHHCCLNGLKTTVTIIQDNQPGIVNVQNRYGRTAICLAAMSRELDIVHELLKHRGNNIEITLSDIDGYNLLHHCCKYGFEEEVLMIVQKHPEIVNVQNEYGETAIIIAAIQGQKKTVNEMLQHRESNIDISLSDIDGFNLLHHCIRYGLKTEALMILETHPEIINVQNKNGETALIMAAMSRKTEIVHELLQHRESTIDIKLTDKDGNTLLHNCCRYGLKKEVLMILETNPEIVHSRNKNGETAIFLAAKSRKTDIVHVLLQHREDNIDLSIPHNDHETLLHYCCRFGLETEAFMILETDPEIINVQNKYGETAIIVAAKHGEENTVNEMLRHRESIIDVTLTDKDGNTLLHHCCLNGLKTTVTIIQDIQPDIVNVQNRYGRTAICLAAMSRELDIVHELLQHRGSSIDIALTDKNGNTVLHYCCSYGFKKGVLMILETHPGIVNIQNENGVTAIIMAAKHGREETVNKMLRHRESIIDATLTDKDGNTLLHHCCLNGLKTTVTIIQDNQPGIVNVQNRYGRTAICLAAMSRELDIVHELLKHRGNNIEITLSDIDGYNLLHHCCKYGFEAEVLMIVQKHPEIVNVQNEYGETAIIIAAIQGQKKTVNEMLQHRESNIDISLSDIDGFNLLHHCIRYGLKTEALMILETHPEIINVQNKNGETALIMAAMSRKTDIVHELLQHRESNIDIKLTDKDGNTLLHHCCRYGLKKEVLMILETHPEIVNSRNKNGETAIFLAAKSRKTDIVHVLLQHREDNIDLSIPHNDHETLLHYCCRFGLETEALMVLETHPEVINVQNKFGRTPIVVAAINKKEETVSKMLQHRESNIDIALTDKIGNTVLHYCCRYGLKREVLMILETHPGIVNIQNKGGEAAIIIAAVNKKTDIIQEMLKHKGSNIDISLSDNDGNNLLHHCSQNGLKTEVLLILKTYPELLYIQNKGGNTAMHCSEV